MIRLLQMGSRCWRYWNNMLPWLYNIAWDMWDEVNVPSLPFFENQFLARWLDDGHFLHCGGYPLAPLWFLARRGGCRWNRGSCDRGRGEKVVERQWSGVAAPTACAADRLPFYHIVQTILLYSPKPMNPKKCLLSVLTSIIIMTPLLHYYKYLIWLTYVKYNPIK